MWKDKIRFGYLVITVLVVLVFAGSAQAQAPVFEEPFDNPDLSAWLISEEVQVIDGALHLGPDTYAYLEAEWEEASILSRIKWKGEGEILIGYRSADWNSYRIMIGQDFMVAQYEQDQAISEITSVGGLPAPDFDWFELEIMNESGNHQIFANGYLVLEFHDQRLDQGGGILFQTLGDATLEVDYLAVHGAETAPEAAPPDTDGEETDFADDLTWIRTGGPLGGLGYDVRMNQNNPDTMYVTDAFAGVFKSVDGGETWFPSNEGITVRSNYSGDAIPIFCLTVDPHDPNTIWAGTDFQRGIYKSEDGGATWIEKTNGITENIGITFRGITVDPNDSQTIYSGAEIASLTWAGEEQEGFEFDKTKGVVYKSTNGGDNWQAVWRGENLVRYIIVDPRDSNVLYVSTGIFDRDAANSDWDSKVPGGEGILKSTDGGQTWTQINNGLNNLYVGSLVMHPGNPDVLLAGTAHNSYREGGGVYLTTDGGETWDQVLESEAHSVEFSTSNPNIAYSGNLGEIFRSSDGGFTWEMMVQEEGGWGGPGVEAGFPIDFQVDPRDPDRIFANNYGGGNFLSEDGGRTWISSSTGYTGAQTRWVAVSPAEPGVVYAGARSGIFVSTNGGGKWDGLIYPNANGLDWVALAIDPEDPMHVLAANKYERATYESNNGGLSWKLVDKLILEFWHSPRVIAFAPSDPQLVYLGYGSHDGGGSNETYGPSKGIYISHNGGTNWSSVNDAQTEEAHVSDIAIHPSNPQIVYMASPNDGLFKSEAGGGSWTNLTSAFEWWFRPSSVAINPANPDLLLMGSEGNGLYRSVDAGQTWAHISAGIPPESKIPTVLFHPINPLIAFCGDLLSGVYLSYDGGLTWQAISNGLRTRAVNKLAISSDGWHLYAATEGEGVFRLDLNGQAPAAGAPLFDDSPPPAPDQPADEPQGPAQTEPGETIDPGNENEFNPPELSTILIIIGVLTLLAVIIMIVVFRRRTR